MADITVLTRGGLQPYVTHLATDTHQLVADEPLAQGGQDLGPDPYELLLASLGACTSITVRMYAARKGWPLLGADVRLTFHRDEAGAPGIRRDVTLTGPLSPEQRGRLLQIANQCPIHKLLSDPLPITTALVPDPNPSTADPLPPAQA